jgi:hypothetical protein
MFSYQKYIAFLFAMRNTRTFLAQLVLRLITTGKEWKFGSNFSMLRTFASTEPSEHFVPKHFLLPPRVRNQVVQLQLFLVFHEFFNSHASYLTSVASFPAV